jgi:hypothetical protein
MKLPVCRKPGNEVVQIQRVLEQVESAAPVSRVISPILIGFIVERFTVVNAAETLLCAIKCSLQLQP